MLLCWGGFATAPLGRATSRLGVAAEITKLRVFRPTCRARTIAAPLACLPAKHSGRDSVQVGARALLDAVATGPKTLFGAQACRHSACATRVRVCVGPCFLEQMADSVHCYFTAASVPLASTRRTTHSHTAGSDVHQSVHPKLVLRRPRIETATIATTTAAAAAAASVAHSPGDGGQLVQGERERALQHDPAHALQARRGRQRARVEERLAWAQRDRALRAEQRASQCQRRRICRHRHAASACAARQSAHVRGRPSVRTFS